MYAICNLISHNRLRWLSLVAVAYTVVTLPAIHADLHQTLINDSKAGWQQPIATNAFFSTPISAEQWSFDYEVTEQVLAKVKLDDSGELLLNPGLADILTEAVDSLPRNMNDKALHRAAFLVSKGLPDVPGQQLASVFINYYHLQHASTLVASSGKSKLELAGKRSTFQATIERQDHYLGTGVATQLFGKQRRITHYLYQRREIRESSNLSPQQKQKKLHTLQNQRKDAIKTNSHVGLINR